LTQKCKTKIYEVKHVSQKVKESLIFVPHSRHSAERELNEIYYSAGLIDKFKGGNYAMYREFNVSDISGGYIGRYLFFVEVEWRSNSGEQ
jgi:hypothetical protein